MEPSPTARAPFLVAFRCPFCTSEQAADLVAVSRAGSVPCGGCKRRLSRAQVSEAIARARRPAGSPSEARRGGRLWA